MNSVKRCHTCYWRWPFAVGIFRCPHCNTALNVKQKGKEKLAS